MTGADNVPWEHRDVSPDPKWRAYEINWWKSDVQVDNWRKNVIQLCGTRGEKGRIRQASLNEAEEGTEDHVLHGFMGHVEEAGLHSMNYEEMF